MALKATIETIDGLPAEIAREYTEVEQDGKKFYSLQVEGAEDVGALKRAKDYEKKERQAIEKKLKDIQSEHERLTEELEGIRKGAIPKGDVEKLEGSYKEKINKITAEKDEQLNRAQGTLQRLLVDNIATSMASKISNSPDLMLPHIKARLITEATSDGYITRVLDADGKPSAMSIEELQKELVADKRFSPIIIGSKASGGGASGGGNGSGAPPSAINPKFDWNKGSPRDIVAQLKAKKAAQSGG
jgi:hypothetical protein